MGCFHSTQARGVLKAQEGTSQDPKEQLRELEQSCKARLDAVQHLLEDSAHARSQAQWLKELIAAYTMDLRQCQQDLEGYSRDSAEGEGDDDIRVGSQRQLARKLHGVSEKHKEHLSRALNGIVSRARVEIGFCEQELDWCRTALSNLNRLSCPKGTAAKKTAADMAEIQAKAESVEETYLKTLQCTYNECKDQLQAVLE